MADIKSVFRNNIQNRHACMQLAVASAGQGGASIADLKARAEEIMDWLCDVVDIQQPNVMPMPTARQ